VGKSALAGCIAGQGDFLSVVNEQVVANYAWVVEQRKRLIEAERAKRLVADILDISVPATVEEILFCRP